ncbi:hypothetical protein J3459_010774 [Metarhizium acridum]|nr:hypothetical protein J3459_010774 [Metarhizium acridum]
MPTNPNSKQARSAYDSRDMPASDEAQYDRRRLQNRESQRRYRHRKEQASQVFDVSLTAPERPTRDASSIENHGQAQVPSAAAAAVVVSQFQKENQAAWDGKVAAKGAVFCESSNQYQFEMPESPMDVLSDHTTLPLTVRYKESKSREASDPMLYPPKGPEYPLMYSFPFESGEPSEAADTFILPSSSGKEAAAEEMPRMETGRFSVERIEATSTASPPSRRLEDGEATADAAHGLRQTRPVSTARTQYMGMTPQATPRQLECVDDTRMPKSKASLPRIYAPT